MNQEFDNFVPFGYITLDDKGIIKEANSRIAQMLDSEINDIINSHFINYIYKNDQIILPLNQNNFSDCDQNCFDVRFETINGLFWVRINIYIDGQLNGQGKSLKLIIYDIDDLKQTEQKAFELKKQLQQAQKMEAIGVLSSGIVHDFNNILHPIIGSLEILIEDNVSDQKLKKSLNNILAGANRASNLSRQILNLNNKKDFAACPIKMQPIIREAIKLTKATLPANIQINYIIDNQCRSVMADSTHIHQIAMNLITNAFQAMEYEGGILDISLKETELTSEISNTLDLRPGIYACLQVNDTGKGMDVSITNNIFDPYFTTKETGTGLGLSVILNIVKAYGGNINFSSIPGKASSFQVYIPIINSKSNTTFNKNKTQQNLYGNESILLIDDEPFIIDVQQEIFERHGYAVKSFVSSADALNEFNTRPDFYDIVMCDMTMPIMTGLALADKIKKIKSDIKIIICTGFSQLINQDTYHSLGIDGFLMKPFKKQESLELIRNILDNR